MSDAPEPTLRARLTALRAALEAQIESADPRTLPGLSREYRALLADIEKLPAETSTATVDQLRERRAARRTAAADSARTAER